jgi:hypothetical protein
MYHLLKCSHKPRLYQGTYYSLTERRETGPEMGATDREPLAEVEASSTGTTNREPSTEPEDREPIYTVIGEAIVPEEEADTVTILIKTHPALSECQQDEGPEDTEPEENPYLSFRRRRLAPVGWMLVGVALVLAGVVVVTLLLPWWEASATVTIVPITHPISTTFTAHLVPGNADPASQQIQGRQLVTLTMSQSKTVATTGSGSQPAQPAQGLITLYNALPTAQTIQAGTLIIG